MHVITGATGHVGAAVVETLIKNKQRVLALTHSALKIPRLWLEGASVEHVDIENEEELSSALSRGETAFILNPPGRVDQDFGADETRSIKSLLNGIARSSVQNIVAESTQGAQSGTEIGDLGTLYELEEGLRRLNRNVRVTRAAYYFSNFDLQADVVKKTGVLQSFFPSDFKLPMVAPEDLGKLNAERLMKPFEDQSFEVVNMSGPREYTMQDVADQFARVFQRDVRVEVVPKAKWIETYQRQGFSEVSARSFSAMTRITLEQDYEMVGPIVRGSTTLETYFDQKFS